MCCFSCEADVCCRRGKWQIHFQSSLGYRGTSWKPKTKFPLKFFSVAVRDSSIVFLFRGERTSKNFQKERYIYKGVLQNPLAPSTVCVKANYLNSFCYVSWYIFIRYFNACLLVLQKHGPTKLDNSFWINFIFSLSLNKFNFALHEILQKGSILRISVSQAGTELIRIRHLFQKLFPLKVTSKHLIDSQCEAKIAYF